MADSVTDILLNRGAPRKSLCDLPSEMLWSICSHSNLVSLMRLSVTCSAIRYQVHEIFTTRISAQAAKYPEVRRSLDRLDWKKKHNFWDCKCFQMMGGPLFTWSHLQEHRDFAVVCKPDLSLNRTLATAGGKLFFMTSDREINYRQMASGTNEGHNSQRTLVKFNNVVISVRLVTYDNVLAVCFKNIIRHEQLEISDIVCVFNASTLVKVSELTLGTHRDGISLHTRSVFLTRDTMAVHLDYNNLEDRESKIQIWKLNTQEPQEEGISLLYTVSRDTAMISKRIFFTNNSVRVNDRLVVIFDSARVVKVFTRGEETPQVGQIVIENKTLRGMSLQGGQGVHLALLLVHLDEDNNPKPTVSVYSATRGDLIVQKEFNISIDRWDYPFFMTWFGDNLIIGLQEANTLSLYTWQPGLASFLDSPFQVPVVRRSPRGNRRYGPVWIANCLAVDFQGVNIAVYDEFAAFLGRTVHYFNTWK